MSESNNTLTKNAIKHFILKIDFSPPELYKNSVIVEHLSKHFDRVEKREISNISLKFTQQESEVLRNISHDYVMVSEAHSVNITFSDIQNAFWIESNKYTNNSIYKEMLELIVNAFKELFPTSQSRRIGMRYVNEFTCSKMTDIRKIFNPDVANIIKSMLRNDSIMRAIAVEEYNYTNFKSRVQYGISNKFYPSIISTYDSILDIDCFNEIIADIDDWDNIIKELNHCAYGIFKGMLNEKYIEDLK
ncbi:MAG TPA: TIGR04255 family protein [Spirochaetota bacterium]|nr:TIGR04255 family protein [Spirochaetota bacterium]